jgi:hypothetical protein
MEKDLKEALYALNRALGHEDADTEYRQVCILARDEIWAVGVRLYGWRD